ncbi:MAG: hypothetical protein M3N59_00240 [bacterium]|nr:hypothetical protein [bacterium]
MSKVDSPAPKPDRPTDIYDLIAEDIASGDEQQMGAADARLSFIHSPDNSERQARRDGLVLDLAEAWAKAGRGRQAVKTLGYLSADGIQDAQAVTGLDRILRHIGAEELRRQITRSGVTVSTKL